MIANVNNLEVEIAAIKAAHEAATRARIRAEHARDTAQAHADTMRKQLAEEFGVDTIEKAQELLSELDAKLAETLSETRRLLDEAGA